MARWRVQTQNRPCLRSHSRAQLAGVSLGLGSEPPVLKEPFSQVRLPQGLVSSPGNLARTSLLALLMHEVISTGSPWSSGPVSHSELSSRGLARAVAGQRRVPGKYQLGKGSGVQTLVQSSCLTLGSSLDLSAPPWKRF